MNINKFILGVAFFVVCLAFSGSFVMGDSGAKGRSGKPVPAGGVHGGKGHAPDDGSDLDIHHALEELKLLTSAVTKKTQDNKSILIGSTIANAVLLTVVTALVGYSLKDKKKKNDDQEETTS